MLERADTIKNVAEVEEQLHYLDQPTEHYRTRRRLGKATGAERLGVNHCRLRPGQVSSRFHFHTREEEFVFILQGRAILRLGDAECELGPGDAVSFRPGGPPHQLRNDFDEDCLYLDIGVRDSHDVVVYPEDGFQRRGAIKEAIA
jgi:uncharacterized cupin superfamily protein